MYHDSAGCKVASCDCKITGRDLRGETRIPPFRSIANITNWLVRLIYVTIIVTIISIGGLLFQSVSFDYNSLDFIFQFIGNVGSIVSIIAVIIGLFWYYRANKNIHSFGAKQVWRPILSVIWWFIPVLNLYFPYDVTQQIWKASSPQTKLANGMEWQSVPSSKIVKLWWILLLVSIFGVIIVTFSYGLTEAYFDAPESFVDSTADMLSLNIVIISFSTVSIVATIYFLRIIKQISIWQEQKSGVSI